MAENPDTIRERIRRWRMLLEYNRDQTAREVLEQMIKEAEAQLPLALDPDRHE